MGESKIFWRPSSASVIKSYPKLRDRDRYPKGGDGTAPGAQRVEPGPRKGDRP